MNTHLDAINRPDERLQDIRENYIDPEELTARIEEAKELCLELECDTAVVQWPLNHALVVLMARSAMLFGGDARFRTLAYIDRHGVHFAEGVEDPRGGDAVTTCPWPEETNQ